MFIFTCINRISVWRCETRTQNKKENRTTNGNRKKNWHVPFNICVYIPFNLCVRTRCALYGNRVLFSIHYFRWTLKLSIALRIEQCTKWINFELGWMCCDKRACGTFRIQQIEHEIWMEHIHKSQLTTHNSSNTIRITKSKYVSKECIWWHWMLLKKKDDIRFALHRYTGWLH